MKRLSVSVLAFLLPILLCARDLPARVDSLLKVLDREVENRGVYMNRRGDEIRHLMQRSRLAANDRENYRMLHDAFYKSRSYSMDTALLVARECRRVAQRIGNRDTLLRATLMEVEALKGIGYYASSLMMLDSISAEVRASNPQELYSRYCSIYYSLLESTHPDREERYFHNNLCAYRDTLARMSAAPLSRIVNLIELQKLQGDYRGAIDTYRQYTRENPGDADDTILGYVVAEALLKTGSVDSAKYFFAKVAINDIRDSVRKYSALQTLAQVLSDEGDVKRAYNYIICSLTDIKCSNSMPRMTKIIEALPIITAAYRQQEEIARKTQRTFNIIVLVIAILLFVALHYAYRKNKRLSRERALLRAKNDELTEMKRDLDELNSRLEESSRAKEEYIGQLFNLCSEYINIMAREHNSLYKILKTGKLADVEKALGGVQNSTRLKAFYDKFDKVFLDLFPDFVDKFNALMQPDYRVSAPEGTLTSELRIFALVRLGFTDTAQIAAFLNISPQTVYNYRFRARTHAIVDRDTFLERVSTL